MGSLTQPKIDALIKAKRPLAGVSDGAGLTLTISAAGGVRWVLRFRLGGKPREVTLTDNPNLQNARKLARAKRVEIDEGIVPQARAKELIKPSSGMTFSELADDYVT